jgi:hypothetical protein
MPEHDAENCEAVFRAAIMLQVNGIDHVYHADTRIRIINAIVAAGL